jgi:hypothetical protein
MTRLLIPFGGLIYWTLMEARLSNAEAEAYVASVNATYETFLEDIPGNSMAQFKRCVVIFQNESDAALFKLKFL